MLEAHKRRQAISTLLNERGEVAIEDLALRLAVSENTVRNDLSAMEDEGLLRRVRGGAVTANGDGIYAGASRATLSPAFAERLKVRKAVKESIGAWAARLVQDGDALVLDASSTVYYMALCLQERRNLTVVTNGLNVALLLAQNPSNKVILAANEVRPDGFSVVGRLNPDILNHFYASKCFVSCSGFSLEQGLTELYVDEAVPKSHMIRLAREVITLIDHSKFGRIDTYRFAELNQIHHLVVDEAMAPEQLAALRELGEFPITVVGRAGTQALPPRPASRKERTYRIGFGNLSEKMLFAQQVRRSLERAARRFETVDLLVRDNALDRQTALENAEWFVAQGVDLLIEFQIDAQAGNVIMDKVNQAGIPVIAVDIPLPGATFFGADNYRAGWMAGQGLGNWVSEHWGGKIDTLIKLEAFRVGPGPGARVQGLQEGLEAVIGPLDPDQIIDIDSPVLVDESTPLISQLLPELPRDARIAIAGINDEAVLGALAAFEAAGRLQQVAAVGQNADRLGRAALRRPDFPFIGSTSYAPERYGEQLLALALKILRGEAAPPAIFIQHTFITKQNIDDYYPLEEDSKVFELGASHHEPITRTL